MPKLCFQIRSIKILDHKLRLLLLRSLFFGFFDFLGAFSTSFLILCFG